MERVPNSRLFRRLWRWHFFAGLICLPFLVSLAVTGALYLFHNEIEDHVYHQQLFVAPPKSVNAALLRPQRMVEAALAAEPGIARAWTGPAAPGRTAQVDVASSTGMRQVFVDPYTGQVAGSIDAATRLMTVIKHIHSLALLADGAKYVIEAVAGWLLVLVFTGLYLWWPRGRGARGGVLSVRATPASRVWWRDVHAICGVFAATALAFLALTGMPWSVFWGSQVNRMLTEHGLGVPAAMWRQVPRSAVPVTALGDVPWTLRPETLPMSVPLAPNEHAGHEGHDMGVGPMMMREPKSPAGLGPDQAAQIFSRLGLPAGYRLSLPSGPTGVYTATAMPDAVAGQRIVHLDRYSGRVLADIGYANFGVIAKVTEWGVSVHKGREYGRLNQYLLLLACLMLVLLAASGVVMYWRRRPPGTLAAPPRRDDDTVEPGVIAIAVGLGVFFPVLGGSMLLMFSIAYMFPE